MPRHGNPLSSGAGSVGDSCKFLAALKSLKEKKMQSKCLFRLGHDDIDNPYKIVPDIFDFFLVKL